MALVKAEEISKKFAVGRRLFRPPQMVKLAVDNVKLSIERGQIVGLVGKSGCGKTTLARIIMHLLEPDSGRVVYRGRRIDTIAERKFRPYRRRLQAIFQDPRESLDPRYRIAESLAEPARYLSEWSGYERRQRIRRMLDQVGLREAVLDCYPHQLSGGQRQRVCIARALLLKPEFIVCDEPTSALDVSIEAQIINLLLELKEEYGLTYLFISHDLSLVRFFCDRLAVMHAGRIVERGKTAEVCRVPESPWTRQLLEAVLPEEGSERGSVGEW